MKLAVFMGSPRKTGNTARMSKVLLRELKKREIAFDYIEPPKKVFTCQHCGYCIDHNTCFCKDELKPFIDKFDEYDGFIIMSPIYFFSFPASVKAFIERLGSHYHEDWEGKIFALILSSGSAERMGGKDLVEDSIIRTCEYHNCLYAGCYNKVTNDKILPVTEIDRDEISSIIDAVQELYEQQR